MNERSNKYIEYVKIISMIMLYTLNFCSSVFDIVSALAIIGMILTLVSSFFMQTRSIDFKLKI